MLSTMRKGAGSLPAKILLGFIILTFAVWGAGDIARQHSGNNEIARVGKVIITPMEVEREVRGQLDQLKQRLGKGYDPRYAAMLGIPQQVLAQKINRELFVQEAFALGLIPSDMAAAKELRKDPNFKKADGTFDAELFTRSLQQMGLSERQYIAELKRDMAIGLLLDALRQPAHAPELAVRLAAAQAKDSRNVTLYTISADALGALPAPSEAQLQSVYDANIAMFTTPELRRVSYAVIEPKAGDEESTTQTANAIEDAVAGGATFKEVQAQFGLSGQATAAFSKQGVSAAGTPVNVPALERFVDTAFATGAGELSTVVNGGGGKLYILHVDDVQEERAAPLADVKAKVMELWKQDATTKGLEELSETIAQAMRDPAKREEAQRTYSLQAEPVRALTRAAKQLPKELVDEVFARKTGEATGVHASGSNRYQLAVVDAVLPLTLPPADAAAKASLENALAREQLEAYQAYLRGKYNVRVNEEALKRLLDADA